VEQKSDVDCSPRGLLKGDRASQRRPRRVGHYKARARSRTERCQVEQNERVTAQHRYRTATAPQLTIYSVTWVVVDLLVDDLSADFGDLIDDCAPIVVVNKSSTTVVKLP